MTRGYRIAALFSLASAACSTVAVEPVGTKAAKLTSTSVSGVTSGKGFVLQPSAAPIVLTNPTDSRDPQSGFVRHRGSDGAVTLFNNGSTLGSLNRDSPANLAFPFDGAVDDDNAKVENYFVSAGIPRDQILAMHANAKFTGGGQLGGRESPIFRSYSTILSRSIRGI